MKATEGAVMERLTAARWLVLDNLKQGWPYRTNLDAATAEEAYLWCVRNEMIKDGKITAAGLVAIMPSANRRAEGCLF